jgi:PAS domain S-box-containing protein
MLEGFALHEIICDDQGKPVDYRFLDMNPAFEKLTGLNREQALGKTVLTIMPGTESFWIEKYGQVALSGIPIDFESRSGALNREYHVVAFSPRKNQFAVIFSDITESKKADAALRESEEKFRMSFYVSPDAMVITRLSDKKIVTINNGFTEILGYSEADVEGKNTLEINVWADQADRGRLYELMQKTGKVEGFEARFLTKTRELRWGMMSARIIEFNGEKHLLNITRDITERKRLEEEIAVNEIKFRNFVENINDIIYSIDATGVITYVSPVSLLNLGYQPEDVVGHAFMELIHPEDAKWLMNRFKQVLSGERAPAEYRVRTKSGEYRWVSSSSKPLYINGKLAGLQGVMVDIDEKKNIALALEKSELQLKAMFDGSPIIILLLQDGKVTYLNRAARDITGWDVEDIKGKALTAFVHQDDIKLISDNYQKRIAGEVLAKPYILRINKKDGGSIYGEVNGKMIMLDGKPTILGFIVDVTEQKQADDQVRAMLAEKELILKEVHHRIKNNFNTMVSLLELQASASTEPAVQNALKQAQGPLRSMLVMYDKLYRSENVNALSSLEYLPTLTRDVIHNLPDGSQVRIDCNNIDDQMIDADSLKPLGLLINELLTNTMKYAFRDIARDAVVTVALNKKDNSWVELIVADNGKGLPVGFAMENSSGFGMTLVQMLVQQLAGTLTVNSQPDQGTEWKIEFKSGK